MDITPKGTLKEQKLFTEVLRHYALASEDLDTRIKDWDKKDELFYSHIDESGWPYQSEIFVPQTFTALFEKMARLNGGKPRGRLTPREGTDLVKAKINNELLSFQWDDASRVDNEPMVTKYALMDLNTRRYGASFGLVKWRYECDSDGNVIFDGPTLKVLNNRDCLPNPSYSTIKNWFQYRDYLTIQELQYVNDISNVKPKYKNLNALRKSVQEKADMGGDKRDPNYTSKSRSLQGLNDFLGRDESNDFKVIEVITELRNDRVISFAPNHGIIIRDEPNPYKHRRIPVICLKYIPVDDDIYGLSEIQPIEKIQRAINAFTSQFMDAGNMDLYRILKVNPTMVQMHTLEWGPGKKWEMNSPDAVVPLEHSTNAMSQFINIYSVLTSMLKEAMGESSAAFSTLKPFDSEKTASEINSRETVKNIRDNFNQIFQAEAIKLQTILWQQMNKQFLFSDPSKQQFILRVVGREAMASFQKIGLDAMIPDISDAENELRENNILMAADQEVGNIQPSLEPKSVYGVPGKSSQRIMQIEDAVNLTPKYPVNVGGEILPKMEMDETGEMATLYVEPDDLSGEYDFVIDVEPMAISNTQTEITALKSAIDLFSNPAIMQQLQMEGKQIDMAEISVAFLEKLGLKGADRFIKVMEGQTNGQVDANGNPIPAGAGQDQGGGIAPGVQAAPGIPDPTELVANPSIPQLG